jgi:hypothetical protein
MMDDDFPPDVVDYLVIMALVGLGMYVASYL